MSGWFARAAGWAVAHRSKLPRWVQRLMESAARNPDGFVGRIAGRLLGGGGPAPTTSVPDAGTRVYIAPTNYAGQGFRWARALEEFGTDVAARNSAIELPGGFAFPADTLVPIASVNASGEWAEAEWEAARQFTHVLVEAERPMFGKRFQRDLAAEITALGDAGLSVAFLCHGTDIRDPERHAELTPWSMYPEDPRTAQLQADARANAALIAGFDLPVFISTPDLVADVPDAFWCPVVVDVERFRAPEPPSFSGRPLRIAHAPSDPLVKGSNYIEPALAPLIASGAVEYTLITGTPSALMPAAFAAADVVIDQFRAGSYGVAACEAMAAGRVVIGHVMPFAREYVRAQSGLNLPIVEAAPDTLLAVVEEILADPDRARRIAADGPEFVEAVHSGRLSAATLLEHWITDIGSGTHTGTAE